MRRNKIFRYHPYHDVAIGIMIPPFSSIIVDYSHDEYLEVLKTRYPIVVSEWYVDNIDKDIVFVPMSMAYNICKPVRLFYGYIERDDDILVTYKLNGSKTHFVCIATQTLALVSIAEIRKYAPRKCFDETVTSDVGRNLLGINCSYLVASKVKVISKLNTNNIAFLKKLTPGTKVKLRHIYVAVDGHPEGVEELSQQITFSVRSLRYPVIAEIVSVVAYPRNNIFVNAINSAIPLSSNYRYTVARIGYNGSYDLLLVIAWDVDAMNPCTSSLPLFNAIELTRFANHDLL